MRLDDFCKNRVKHLQVLKKVKVWQYKIYTSTFAFV